MEESLSVVSEALNELVLRLSRLFSNLIRLPKRKEGHKLCGAICTYVRYVSKSDNRTGACRSVEHRGPGREYIQ